MVLLFTNQQRMEKDKNEVTKRILNLTLEIIYRLTGEDYTIVKKTSSKCVTPKSRPLLSRERSKFQRTHEQNNEKILDLTHKIIELLTGEVPIRCQDVAVYFSVEEWEYIEDHKNLYKDVMMEDHRDRTSPGKRDLYKDIMMEDHRNRTSPGKRDLYKDVMMEDHRDRTSSGKGDLYKDVMMEDHRNRTSSDGSSKRNPPERCPSPPYSQDCPEEDHNVPQDHQLNSCEDLIDIKIEVIDGDEEANVRGDECKKEEVPVNISPDFEERNSITQGSSGENSTRSNIHPQPFSRDPSSYSSNLKRTSGQSPAVTQSTGYREGPIFPCPEPEDHLTQKSDGGERGQPSTWESYILEHQRRYTGEKPLPSADDGRSLTQRPYLLNQQRTNMGPPQFLCLECGKWFTQESDLSKHQKIHTGEKPFSCAECGKSYAQKSGLFEHQKLHTGKKPFSCSDCGRCFTRKSSLVEHGRIHTGEKPFICLECGKCFTYKSGLSEHEKIHTGERPFSCSVCGKCFNKRAVLVNHLRTHTGERPFPCLECGKCFTDKSVLVKHQRIHTGEKPFSCSECGRCFTQKSVLDKHQRIHKGEKPFSCSECGRCFTQKSVLMKHQRIHTGDRPFLYRNM